MSVQTQTIPDSTVPANGRPDNLLDLIAQLGRQGSDLAQQQLQLVQAEVRETGDDVKAAIGSFLGAAVVGIAGLGVLLMGLAFLLGNVIEDTGLATVIVGGAALLVALILYAVARRKISATHLSPERTRRTLERTPDAVTGDL